MAAVVGPSLRESMANLAPIMLSRSARFDLSSGNWVTTSNSSTVASVSAHAEECGSGPQPEVLWEHAGDLINSDLRLVRCIFKGRIVAGPSVDVDLRVVSKAVGAWHQKRGITDPSQLTPFFLVETPWMTDDFNGEPNLFRVKTADLNFPKWIESDLSIYVRPTAPCNSGDFFELSWTYVFESFLT